MWCGYWTYHKTYENSCCCTPCCLMAALTIPAWPLICGAAIVKEKIPLVHSKVTVYSAADEQKDAEELKTDSYSEGNKLC